MILSVYKSSGQKYQKSKTIGLIATTFLPPYHSISAYNDILRIGLILFLIILVTSCLSIWLMKFHNPLQNLDKISTFTYLIRNLQIRLLFVAYLCYCFINLHFHIL